MNYSNYPHAVVFQFFLLQLLVIKCQRDFIIHYLNKLYFEKFLIFVFLLQFLQHLSFKTVNDYWLYFNFTHFLLIIMHLWSYQLTIYLCLHHGFGLSYLCYSCLCFDYFPQQILLKQQFFVLSNYFMVKFIVQLLIK